MKNVGIVGVLLLVLDFVFYRARTSHREHGVKIGDTKIGVQTQSSEKLPRGSIILLAGGCSPCPREPQELAALSTSAVRLPRI